MADITYCDNNDCPFNECERHPSKLVELRKLGIEYVSMASFGRVCRKYIGYVLHEINDEQKG